MRSEARAHRLSVDVNEEFSAFHGPVIHDQAEFLKFCIRRVLRFYDHLPLHSRPSKVTLLGHSMGGIISRLAVARGDAHLVDAIITMSTPHLLPPVTLDADIELAYRQMQNSDHSRPLLFSLCGGLADSQIASDSCILSRRQISANDGFAVLTSGLPGAWTGVDHQAMVWCHQIRWTVARTILEMTKVDSRSDKLTVAQTWLLPSHSLVRAVDPESLSATLDIPIVSPNITLLIRGSRFDNKRNQALLDLEWCKSADECLHVDSELQAFPAPMDDKAPFPSPGEGIKPSEVGFALSLNPAPISGHLRLHSLPGVQVDHGLHSKHVIHGSSWGEPGFVGCLICL